MKKNVERYGSPATTHEWLKQSMNGEHVPLTNLFAESKDNEVSTPVYVHVKNSQIEQIQLEIKATKEILSQSSKQESNFSRCSSSMGAHLSKVTLACVTIFKRHMIYILLPSYLIFAFVSIGVGFPDDISRLYQGVFGSMGYFISLWSFRYLFAIYVRKPIGQYIELTEGAIKDYNTWSRTSGSGKNKETTTYESFSLEFTIYYEFYYYDIHYDYYSTGNIFRGYTKTNLYYYVDPASKCYAKKLYFQLPPNVLAEIYAFMGCLIMAVGMFVSASVWTLFFSSNISFFGNPNSIEAGVLMAIGLLGCGWYAKYNGRFNFSLELEKKHYNRRPNISGYCQKVLAEFFPEDLVKNIMIPYIDHSVMTEV